MENSRSLYFKQKLKQYTDELIADDAAFITKRIAADQLHSLFVEAGGIDALAIVGPETFSAFGVAVAPGTAARCLLEFARTAKFARGLQQALQFKLQATTRKPLNILYAGSGPYGLLAMLMTPYFGPEEIQFTVIDIHDESLDSLKKIIEQFGAADYFREIILADAIEYTADENNRPDVLVTETMLNALRKEPQVSIAANLVPQLAEGGIMIPEEITVTPVFTNISIRNAMVFGEDLSGFTQPAFHSLKAIAVLNKKTAVAANAHIQKPFAPVSAALPQEFLLSDYSLELQTTIKVWNDEILQLSDCSLTIPAKISEGDRLLNKQKITFTYNNGAMPGFSWELD